MTKTIEKVFISEADQYLFSQGTHYDIYKKLGAHPSCENGKKGIYFGVWAPNAKEVYVIGSFNDWNETAHPMKKLGPVGIWGVFIPTAKVGDMYKFLIHAKDGSRHYKADPFANQAEFRPGTASVIASIEPVVATLVGILIYKEEMSLQNVIGICLVLGSIVLINWKNKQK